jgi:ribosome-associated heat shock protein Hsp15
VRRPKADSGAAGDGGDERGVPDTQRLDKWLWQARFFKTRGLAARTVSEGRVRVNGQRVMKPSAQVRAGDVLTFAQGDAIRVVRVEALAIRRGPSPEAVRLYADLPGGRT